MRPDFPSADVLGLTLPNGGVNVTVDLSNLAGDWSHLPERVQIVPADAIVIPRADLPEVRPVHDGIRVDGFYRVVDREFGDHDAHTARGAALRLLALADYLDAHPSVDEAQVEALAEAMRSAQNLNSIPEMTRDFARRLVAAGVRIEVTP